VGAMVNQRLIFVWMLSAAALTADVRYTLKCEIESTDKVILKTGALATAMRECTSTILQTGERQLTRTERFTQIVDFAKEDVVTLDHEKKTWTKFSTAKEEQAAQASIMQLQQMGAVFRIVSNPISEPKMIGGFEAKGMVSVLEMSFNYPGMQKGMNSRAQMEFWVSETAPGAKEIMASSAKNKLASPTMRMMGKFLATVPGGSQVLKDGQNLVGQLLEMTMRLETKGLADVLSMRMTMKAEGFDTSAIPASEFSIPDGYTEVK
jgi:hypothetical protein